MEELLIKIFLQAFPEVLYMHQDEGYSADEALSPRGLLPIFVEQAQCMLTFCAEDFLARMSVLPAVGLESLQQAGADFGMNMKGSLKRCNRGTLSRKTFQACFPWELRRFCKTWPRSGMMQSGMCSLRVPAAPRTTVRGYSLLPTLTVHALRGGHLCYLRSQQTC